jgi:eukaryotic-like serine/threonine-protein kinase
MFAGYRDEALVGEGGLGRVYRAVRISTGGNVAIKELRDVAEGSPAWHRARRELEALLRLKGHPYVVSVEEIIEGPNGPCLVMEYLPGGSLFDRVKAGPCQPAKSCWSANASRKPSSPPTTPGSSTATSNLTTC